MTNNILEPNLEPENESVPSGKSIIVIVVSVVAALLVLGGIPWLLFNSTDRGTFGDMFGFANAFFSALAFAGVIYAILLQQNELKLQRIELRYTREELKLTRRELKRAAETQEQSTELIRIQTEIEKNRLILETTPNVLVRKYEDTGRTNKEDPQVLDLEISLENRGQTAWGLRFSSENGKIYMTYKENEAATIDTFEVIHFRMQSNTAIDQLVDPDQTLSFSLSYEDRAGSTYQKRIAFKHIHDPHEGHYWALVSQDRIDP